MGSRGEILRLELKILKNKKVKNMYFIDPMTVDLLNKIDISDSLARGKEISEIMEDINNKVNSGEYGEEIKNFVKNHRHLNGYIFGMMGKNDFMEYCSIKYHTCWVTEEKYYVWS